MNILLLNKYFERIEHNTLSLQTFLFCILKAWGRRFPKYIGKPESGSHVIEIMDYTGHDNLICKSICSEERKPIWISTVQKNPKIIFHNANVTLLVQNKRSLLYWNSTHFKQLELHNNLKLTVFKVPQFGFQISACYQYESLKIFFGYIHYCFIYQENIIQFTFKWDVSFCYVKWEKILAYHHF